MGCVVIELKLLTRIREYEIMKYTNKHADACLNQLKMYEKWYAGEFKEKQSCYLCTSVNGDCQKCVLGPQEAQCATKSYICFFTCPTKSQIKTRALYLLRKFNKVFKGVWEFTIKLEDK
jgi:hypothetical protein